MYIQKSVVLNKVAQRDNKKFTLIELLIVVGIISILVTILLPTLSKAREKAKRAVCLSNLSQSHKANHVYASQNNHSLAPGNVVIDVRMGINSTKSIPDNNPFGLAIPYDQGYFETTDHFYCPSWEHPYMQKNKVNSNGRWGGYTDNPTDTQPTRHYMISYNYRSTFPGSNRPPDLRLDDSDTPYIADHWTGQAGQYVHKLDGYNVLYIGGYAKFNHDKGQLAITENTSNTNWNGQRTKWDLYFKD